MAKRPTTAGDDIEARCTRCREVTNHTVVAMVESRVARVKCNICDGVHNYHPPAAQRTAARPVAAKPEKAAKAAKAPRATARRTQAAEQAEWAEAARRAETAKVTPYAMNCSCRAGELVQHPVFGIGLVKEIVPPAKMAVLFELGTKLLRCR
ncbi:MAG: hypothetical protein WDA20_12960 [Desulfuromonadales bacterium]